MFTRIHPTVSRLTSLVIALALLGGAPTLHMTSRPAQAQAQTSAQTGPAQQPKEVKDLIDAIDDLDLLHVLQPLKLTGEQADKLAAAITAAQAEYDKKSLPLTSVPLLKMADEIRQTRAKALTGTPVPVAFDDRIKGLQTDVSNKRKELDAANVTALGATCKTILSAEQFATCVKLETEAYKRNKRYNEKATDLQYFNAYVLDVFISNPRIVPVLKDMHAALK